MLCTQAEFNFRVRLLKGVKVMHLRLEKIRNLVIFKCFKVLPLSDRRKLPLVVLLQIALALADLVAVGIVGVIAALSVSGIQSSTPHPGVTRLLDFLNLSNFSMQTQAAILGVFAATMLISRTLISVIITRKTLIFLSNRGAGISADIFARLTSQSLSQLNRIPTQEVIYAITGGTSAITLGIIGACLATFADAIVAIVMIFGLFFLNATMAVSMLVFFGFTAALLYKLMSSHSHKLGTLQAAQAISVNETITEALSSYRELLVGNRRQYYVRKLQLNRYSSAEVYAQLQFLPNVSKYIIEVLIVLGAFLISAYEFIAKDANSAIALLAIFLASATRIAPAIMRIQQSAISIKGAAGGAERTLNLIQKLEEIDMLPITSDNPNFVHPDFEPSIFLDCVSFAYPDQKKNTLREINLQVNPGTFVAVVGPSGAGKTTLIDLILGVLNPDKGTIHISNQPPLAAISKWPGAIAYVPQDILISNGTIAENVAFGFPLENVPKAYIDEALVFAGMEKFVNDLPLKDESQVGERGVLISGGQRQRLGIARAILSKPKLLVLDEATSTLDAQTEFSLTSAINQLKGEITIVMIAHRLSTVLNADLVIYLDNGEIKAQGTMAEVRSMVPDFDIQAQLMGL
jgi:ATP-binding cassette, subfamily B, bacterial PglK